MQAIKVNGTSHTWTNSAREYGFAEKCSEDKLYFPARLLSKAVSPPPATIKEPHFPKACDARCCGQEPVQRHCHPLDR